MLALTAVLLANLAAVFVAVALVGPAMFHRKLLLAGHPNEATELTHIEHAFQSVGFTAMIIGATLPFASTLPLPLMMSVVSL